MPTWQVKGGGGVAELAGLVRAHGCGSWCRCGCMMPGCMRVHGLEVWNGTGCR
jgi:hypothetical protein